MSSRVFFTQNDGRHDLSDANRFGSPVFIFSKDIYPDDAKDRMPEVMQRAYNTLHDFNPAQDFLCLVGSPVYVAICSYILGDAGKHPVRLLRFDRLEGRYYPIDIA